MKSAYQLGAALIAAGLGGVIAAMGCAGGEGAAEETAPDNQDEAAVAESELKACGYETCAHPKCTEGMPLLSSACDPCVQTVCAAEPYCCGLDWGEYCLDLVGQLCNKPCSQPYSIKVKSSGKCLHIPSDAIYSAAYLEACSGATEQGFFLTHRGWGVYDLVPEISGHCLGADPWAHSDMEPQILQVDCFSGTLYVVYLGKGYYYLLDRFTGFCYEAVELGGGYAALRQSECDGGNDQMFRFFFAP